MGGFYTIDAPTAKRVADRIGAGITVPMHYRGEGFGYDVIGTLGEYTRLCSGGVEYAESNGFEPRGLSRRDDARTEGGEMKLKAVEKVAGWQYLSRYDVKYETPEGGEKIYEMFSRDPGIDSPEKLLHPRVDAVMIIMTDEPGEHMLLIREFRLELGREIFGLPAGLIDPGETPEAGRAPRAQGGDGARHNGHTLRPAPGLQRRRALETSSASA